MRRAAAVDPPDAQPPTQNAPGPRYSEPPWDSRPIGRAHLDEWAANFQAPDAELALFDVPPLPS